SGGARQPTGRTAGLRRGLEAVPHEACGRAARRRTGDRRAGGGGDGPPARPVREDVLWPPPPRRDQLRSGRERGAARVRGRGGADSGGGATARLEIAIGRWRLANGQRLTASFAGPAPAPPPPARRPRRRARPPPRRPPPRPR